MGQSSSSTIPFEQARLVFSNNSLRNTQVQCDSLGIYYQLSTPINGFKTKRLTSITRWDPQQGKELRIAEWERRHFGKDRIRMISNPLLVSQAYQTGDGFVPVKEFLRRTKGMWRGIRINRTFAANNGKRYTWKARKSSLKLYEVGSRIPIAEYKERHNVINRRPAHIRLGPGCEEILDYIIVTCVIAERKRRDAKRSSGGDGGGGDGGGGGGGGDGGGGGC